MRTIIIAAVAGLSLVACRAKQDEVADKRAEVSREQAEVQRKSTEARAEADQKSVQAQAEADRKVAKENEDLRQDKRELTEKERQLGVDQGTGGAGLEPASASISGTVTSTLGPQIELIDRAGGKLSLRTDDLTVVTLNGQRVDIDDFKKGTEVRASYQAKGDDKFARSVEILKPIHK
jgi:regulator of protease activity HflC (stomatin/prohibitin superfamily)